MKLKHQISLYAGGVGATTLVAILTSIHEQLIQVGPWVLDSLLAASASALIYGGFRVYVSGRQHWLTMREKEQHIRIESERWDVERAALLLGQHLQVARIYPDAKGYMPTVVSAVQEGYQFVSLPHPAHTHVAARSQMALPEQASSLQDEDEQEEVSLPDNVRYEDIKHLVPHGHVLVGVGAQGVETKPQAIGACVWIVGLSGTGKTSTTVLRVEERKQDGHMFLGADPHFFKDDSLHHAIYETLDGRPGPYSDRFLMPMAKTPEEILEVLTAFHDEFKARKAGQRPKPWRKITLLVDEVGSLMDKATATTPAEKAIIELLPSIARICGQEARNFLMGGIFISQQATGISWLRKVALMIIVHQLIQESEKKLATGNDPKVMKEMKSWPVGRTYVLGIGFQEGPHTVQQPAFKTRVVEGSKVVSSDEMEALQPKRGQSAQAALPMTNQLVFEADSDYQNDVFSANSGAKNDEDRKVLTFPKNAANGLVERSDLQSDEGQRQTKEYRFTESESMQFIAAYRVAGNIERVLSSMKKGSGYKKHARELIQAFSLRQA